MAFVNENITLKKPFSVLKFIRLKNHRPDELGINTVEPCTLAQSDHLWGLAVTKPMILSTNVCNMTLVRSIGLQHNQKSASYVKNCGLQP